MKRHLKRLIPSRLVRMSHVADDVAALRSEVAALRQLVEAQHHITLSLNHAVVNGGESGLPFLVDVAERIRSDADATIGATHAVERLVESSVRRLEVAAARIEAAATTPTS